MVKSRRIKSRRVKSRRNKTHRVKSRRNKTHRTKMRRGGDPEACSSNTEPIIKNDNCIGEMDLISSDDIVNGYCVNNNCLDKKTIQGLRAQYLVPRENNYTRADFKKIEGDFQDPFTKVIIKNNDISRLGISDVSNEHDYDDDEYFQKLREEYEEARIQKNKFANIGIRGKQVLNGERVGFNNAI